MQLGGAQLSPTEQSRGLTSDVCLYCGHSVHFVATCPLRPKEVGVLASADSACGVSSRLVVQGTFLWGTRFQFPFLLTLALTTHL